MAFLGVTFTLVGILAEIIRGTRFEAFFDRSYPQTADRWNAYRVNVQLSRLTLCLGLLVLDGAQRILGDGMFGVAGLGWSTATLFGDQLGLTGCPNR